MLIEVRTGGNIQGSERFSEHVKTLVHAALDRFGDRIRRIDVHLSDAVGNKTGHDDKCCMIEVDMSASSVRTRSLIFPPSDSGGNCRPPSTCSPHVWRRVQRLRTRWPSSGKRSSQVAARAAKKSRSSAGTRRSSLKPALRSLFAGTPESHEALGMHFVLTVK